MLQHIPLLPRSFQKLEVKQWSQPGAGAAQSTSSLPPITSELLSSTGHGVGHKELEFSSQQVTFSRGDSVPAAGISAEGGLAASSFCPAVRLSICKCSCTEHRAAS